MNVGETVSKLIAIKHLAAIIILMVAFSSSAMAQTSILKQDVTVKMADVKRQAVLRSLTRQTGFTFTYDTELIKPQEICSISMEKESLESVLDDLFPENNFGYSVIENHIIIFKKVDKTTPLIKEEGKVPVYLISGTVVERSTLKPLPYATVGIYKKGIGTISNEEGNFTLKVNENSLNDSIKISYLGFVDRTILVGQAIENHYVIQLQRDYVPIPEVIIRSREPLDLINNVHLNIGKNYGSSPALLKAFYRESVARKSKILLYSEAVINIYKSAYSKTLQTDQIKIFKSRKFENVDQSDTLLLKLQSGMHACLELDGIKNTFDFLNPLNFNDYNYRMTDIVNVGDEAVYVVEFSQKDYVTDNALYQGSIYINTDNYGVHYVDFEINPDYIDIMSNNYIRESSRGFSVKLKSVNYTIDYRFVNNRYYLSHVRGDMAFHARKKRKFFGSNYNIVFEMAVTEIDTLNVKRFARSEIAPPRTILWETISSYDTDFWGADNYMHPETGIQEALEQLNVRLGEFKKED